MKQNKTKKPLSKGMKIFLDIAMVVSLLVAGFSAWNIVQVLKGYQESKQAYEEVRKEVVVVDKITKKEKVDFKKLRQLYPDTAAWIKMKNSAINYPIAYGDSLIPERRGNEFYLHHLMDGRYQNSGTLFLDVQNYWWCMVTICEMVLCLQILINSRNNPITIVIKKWN